MSRSIPITLATAAVAVGLTLAPSASAHNAGHLALPDGTCHEVRSFTSVLAGPDKTELDLDPTTPSPPFDEIGTSYAAHQGNSALLPGPR